MSTLLAWVSALTNGGAGHHFEVSTHPPAVQLWSSSTARLQDPILEEQAREERDDPLLPKLEAVTQGKILTTKQHNLALK